MGSGRCLMGVDANHAANTTAEAGLPNITAHSPGDAVASLWPTRDQDAFSNYFTGAIRPWYGANWEHSCAASMNTLAWGLDFNASLSSSIYGSSTTVTPLSRSTLMLIKY